MTTTTTIIGTPTTISIHVPYSAAVIGRGRSWGTVSIPLADVVDELDAADLAAIVNAAAAKRAILSVDGMSPAAVVDAVKRQTMSDRQRLDDEVGAVVRYINGCGMTATRKALLVNVIDERVAAALADHNARAIEWVSEMDHGPAALIDILTATDLPDGVREARDALAAEHLARLDDLAVKLIDESVDIDLASDDVRLSITTWGTPKLQVKSAAHGGVPVVSLPRLSAVLASWRTARNIDRERTIAEAAAAKRAIVAVLFADDPTALDRLAHGALAFSSVVDRSTARLVGALDDGMCGLGIGGYLDDGERVVGWRDVKGCAFDAADWTVLKLARESVDALTLAMACAGQAIETKFESGSIFRKARDGEKGDSDGEVDAERTMFRAVVETETPFGRVVARSLFMSPTVF